MTKRYKRNQLGKLVFLGLILPFLLSAQDDSSSLDEDVYELSPFVVDTTGDVGYLANNTLAGARTRTNLSDIASPISVFTREFVDDLAITSEEELFLYSTSAVPEITDQQDNGVLGIAINELVGNVRLRGLPAARTRDYFTSYYPTDSYNVGRYDESRGSNSILFGIGGAGGLMNASTKTAIKGEKFTDLSLKTTLGDIDLLRLTIDSNVDLADNWAVRLNAVWEEGDGWRPHDFRDIQRVHVTSSLYLTDSITVRADFEKGEMNGTETRNFSPQDHLSNWLALPVDQRTTANINFNGIRRNDFDDTIDIYDDRNNRPRLTVFNDGGFRAFQGHAFTQNRMQIVDADTGATEDYIFRNQLLDRDIAPIDAFYSGPGATRDVDLMAATAFIEMNPVDKLFIEAAVRYEEWDSVTHDIVGSVFEIHGEPSEVFRNGDANPYAGDFFIDSQWRGRDQFNDYTTARLTASYEFETAKMGRHILGAFFSWSEFNKRSRIRQLVVEGAPFNNNPENGRNRINTRTYFDRDTPTDQIALTPWQDVFNNTLTLNNDPTYGTVTYSPEWAFSTVNDNKQVINTMMVNGQSYFFENTIPVILTYGYRKDDAYDDKVDRVRHPESNKWVLGTEAERVSDNDVDTLSYGVVVKPKEWISVFYNDSENIELPGTGNTLLPNNENRPLAEGSGKDYGIMLNLLDGRMFVRASYFTSEVENDSTGSDVRNGLSFRSNAILLAGLDEGIITQEQYDTNEIHEDSSNFDLADRSTEGYEINVTSNVTDNWRFTLSASFSDSTEDNRIQRSKQYISDTSSLWDTINAAIDPTYETEFQGATVAQHISAINRWFTQQVAAEGKTSVGHRKTQFSCFTRYTFNDGRLDGFYVGGGYRYASKRALGVDLTGKLHYGEADNEIDLLLGYRTKVSLFGDEKQTLSFQFNARNILHEDEFKSLRIDELGNMIRGRVVAPAYYSLTTTLKF